MSTTPKRALRAPRFESARFSEDKLSDLPKKDADRSCLANEPMYWRWLA
ncbi:hypothetical protein [Natronoglycomyces albus]|uniref:Uncharacterized protein n=1 Tax=Natronoglycomyces albus TaxID=2811108 RepID=A0A895XGH3_9ACTN|nr:hypothetical protein [Natronoglycomyces albus]QSB04444.1 hypothetical protein JQS30_11680 [Natronoglycomyces albus]